jgi:hypothetical protein
MVEKNEGGLRRIASFAAPAASPPLLQAIEEPFSGMLVHAPLTVKNTVHALTDIDYVIALLCRENSAVCALFAPYGRG